jgi:hypothetical protein
MACNCKLTYNELMDSIMRVIYKAPLYDGSLELVYDCECCEKGMFVAGEIFTCPHCNTTICLDCHFQSQDSGSCESVKSSKGACDSSAS